MNEQQGRLRNMRDTARDAAQQPTRNSSPAMCAHNHEVSIPVICLTNDCCDAQLSVMARAAPAFYAARASGKNFVMAAAFSQYRIVGSIDMTAFKSVL